MMAARLRFGPWFLCVALLFGVLSATRAPARAEGSSSEVVVNVSDAKSAKPLPGARVVLFGAVMAKALTDASGNARYEDVPAGVYRIHAAHSGYRIQISPEFSVRAEQRVTLTVTLSTEELRVVETVVAHPTISVSSTDLAAESPIYHVSDSIADALDKLAGVSVSSSSGDPDAVTTISLRGHDETQTAVTLDGVPLAPPGVAADLRAIGTDLFSGAHVSFAPSAASLGGSVNFRTLEPTRSWREQLSLFSSGDGHSRYQLGVTGSAGPLGIAVLHAWRGADSPLNGAFYQDQSGLAYRHRGGSIQSGDLVKLRWRVGTRSTISAMSVGSNRSIAPLCTQDTGRLPCGIGPGNDLFGHYRLATLTLQSLVGDVAAQLTGYTSTATFDADEQDRFFAGVASPLSALRRQRSHGFTFSADASHRRESLTLTASVSSNSGFEQATVGTASAVSSTQTPWWSIELADRHRVNERLSLRGYLSLADASALAASVLGGVTGAWRPTRHDALSLFSSFGNAQPAQTVALLLGDPASARVNCQAQTTLVDGPGDQGGPQSSASYGVGWKHHGRLGDLTVDLYRQRQAGQLLLAQVPASSEPSLYFPPGYLGALAALAASPNLCGAAAASPSVYVREPIAGTTRLYEGFDAAARISLGPHLVALPTYSVNVAKLIGSDPRLESASSTQILGAQLPGRPLHRAGLTLDGLLPHSGLEWTLNGAWTAGNNPRGLGSYAVANAGLSRRYGGGTLTLFVTNLFNTDVGPFSSLQYAQPQPLNGGGALRQAAIPLPARRYTLSYRIALGGPAHAPAPHGDSDGRPRLRAVPPPPGVDPLTMATTLGACTADGRRRAASFLAALRAFVAAYRSGAAPLPIPDVRVVAHPAASSTWWIELHPREKHLREALGCSYITLLTQKQARARGLGFLSQPTLLYAPTVGLYLVRPPMLRRPEHAPS
ncbi:MAG: TonB-dependent receptor [bacterium]|nr:TonB-dependent receptor [bacterium]